MMLLPLTMNTTCDFEVVQFNILPRHSCNSPLQTQLEKLLSQFLLQCLFQGRSQTTNSVTQPFKQLLLPLALELRLDGSRKGRCSGAGGWGVEVWTGVCERFLFQGVRMSKNWNTRPVGERVVDLVKRACKRLHVRECALFWRPFRLFLRLCHVPIST